MRREAQNILLLLVGGALLKITLNGTFLRYVKPTTRPWVFAAGLTMVGLAVVAIIADIRAHGHRTEVAPRDEHGHHGHSRSPWLLLLPVLAIFLIAPPALGADSVRRADRGATLATTGVVQQGAAAFPPLPTVTVVSLPMSEFITRSVWDATNSLNGRTVRLTGFVVRDHGSAYVARLVITCCAADATPMKVRLVGQSAGALADNQWIMADGRVRPGSATQNNGYTPTLDVNAITSIAVPKDPYEY